MVVWAKHWTELKYKALFQNVRGAHDSQEHVFHSNTFDSNPYLVGIVKLLQVQELHHTCPFFFFRTLSCLGISPRNISVLCVWIYKSLWCTFSTPQKKTGFTHFSRSKYEFVPSLHTKCWNEFVWHPHLSMTTTAVPISAQILSRRDNWGLFSFNLAVWSNSLGQSIMLLSKMPAKHYQRQEKRPSAQTKTLASSLLCTSDAHLNSN